MDTSDFFQMNMDQANIVFVKDKDKKDETQKDNDAESKTIVELMFHLEESLEKYDFLGPVKRKSKKKRGTLQNAMIKRSQLD